MKLRKIIAISAVLALALSITACTKTPPSSSIAPPASGSTPSNPTQATGVALKIAICTSPNSVDDGSFNENVYDGILNFVKNNPNSSVTPITETTGAPDAAVQKMAEIVADYDVIVGSGFQFGGINDVATENPDKKFIIVDEHLQVDFAAVELPNVYAMKFAEQESGFFAGMAAALETKTNKVAVVNGQAFPSNVNYQFGFESGVKYVNETEGKSVEVIETGSHNGVDVTEKDIGGNYTGDFSDVEAGKKLGETLIAKGCDIIFVAAGGSGNGVFAAAKEAKDVKVIGCDVDQYDDGKNGDANIMLTSALKVMDICVERALNSIADNSFKGGNVTMDIKTDSTGFVSETGRHQMSDDTVTKIQAAYDKVKSGEIVPASNFGTVNDPDLFIVKK